MSLRYTNLIKSSVVRLIRARSLQVNDKSLSDLNNFVLPLSPLNSPKAIIAKLPLNFRGW